MATYYALASSEAKEDLHDQGYSKLAKFIYHQLQEDEEETNIKPELVERKKTDDIFSDNKDTKPNNQPTCSARLERLAQPRKLPSSPDDYQSRPVSAKARPIRNSSLFTGRKRTIYRQPTLDWERYHRLDVIHTFMDDLEYDFPSICTTGIIGKSLEGRDLKILKISNSNASNTAVWIDAGIHAREWIAPATATFIANNIAKNFSILPNFITNKDWYFLPVMNPDGYEYSHTTNRMWRKNRAWHGGECVGVDLNRNFSYGWGGKGSSNSPQNAFYHGPEPFSEPESSAVRDMLTQTGIKFQVYITLHSYGQLILFPFAHTDDLASSYVRLLEGATVMSRAIFDTFGNIYKVGKSRDADSKAAGTSNDWSHGVAGIPYCYLIELTNKKNKFLHPTNEIKSTGKEILNGIAALLDFVDKNPSV